MRKASQQTVPVVTPRPSRTKRRHSDVEEDKPTSGGRGLLSTIKKFIRGNAVKVGLGGEAKIFYPDGGHLDAQYISQYSMFSGN